MTAIKKITTKTAKSPAPATKAAVVAPAKPAKRATKKSAPSTTPGTNGASSAVPAVEPVAAAPAAMPVAAPAPKAVAPKPVITTITARIDVGFGNTLSIRGEGPGLSWDKGVLMECLAHDEWRTILGESARPFAVKFLINDLTWSTGPDYIVPPGVSVTFAPQF